MSQIYWYLFCKDHPELALEANRHILEEFGNRDGVRFDCSDAYEFCLDNVSRDSLAVIPETIPEVPQPTAEEIRRAENEKLKGMSKEELREQLRLDIRRRFEVPAWTPDFTAKQFKQMSPSQVFAILRYPNGQQREGAAAAIDKLLQESATTK